MYHNRTVRGSFRSAQQYLNSKITECEQSRELDGAHLTLNQYLDRWLELAARPKLRTKSFADYKALLGRSIRPTLGERKLSDLAPLDLQSAYHRMHQKKLSPRTVGYTHAVLHAALEQAVRWRLLSRNPASGVEIAVASSEQSGRGKEHDHPKSSSPIHLFPSPIDFCLNCLMRDSHRFPSLLADMCPNTA
jgi:hypothetical protein